MMTRAKSVFRRISEKYPRATTVAILLLILALCAYVGRDRPDKYWYYTNHYDNGREESCIRDKITHEEFCSHDDD